MQNEFNKRLAEVNLNFSSLGLIGHSAAAHILFTYLNSTCGIIKWIVLIDPVDG